MNRQVELTDVTWSLLRQCAEPFVDKEPEDTIRRALQSYSKNREPASSASVDRSRAIARSPRERGVLFEFNGKRYEATTVSDLYEQVLKFFVDNHEALLKSQVPFRTSSQRFLVATKPVHPSGRKFVVPVKYRGYYMEAHKDYKNAKAHVLKLANRLGVELRFRN
jgi:hypothetical protein